VRLSFSRLQAQVDSRCDDWSEDAAQSDRMVSWQNRSLPNFGCSYQKNLAAQVADPVDLVRPRQQSEIDGEKRLRGVQRLRAGTDPSTIYISGGPTINQGIPNP
jgi:pilus assembly protein CpaD